MGLIGVTTISPQPQGHLWVAVANGIEMYRMPSFNSSGMSSTNSGLIDFSFILGFVVRHRISRNTIDGVMLLSEVDVETPQLLPLDDS